MKLLYFIFSLSAVKAATYNLSLDALASDLTGGTGVAIFDQSGTSFAVGTGFVSIGYFDSLPDFSSASTTNIQSSYNQFGGLASVNGSSDLGGGYIAEGMFSSTFSSVVSSSFNGQSIYVMIGNGNDLVNSSELLVLSTGATFDVPASGSAPEIESFDLTSLLTPVANGGSNSFVGGSYDISNDGFATTQSGGPYAAGTSYQTFTVVPEPTSAALAGLAGLAFLVRRKRA